jgi:hypothetical protein
LEVASRLLPYWETLGYQIKANTVELRATNRQALVSRSEAYLLYIEGRLDDAYWQTRASIFRTYMEASAGREVYRQGKAPGLLHTDFVDWADQVLDEN